MNEDATEEKKIDDDVAKMSNRDILEWAKRRAIERRQNAQYKKGMIARS